MSIEEKILKIVDETKKQACLDYGWSFLMWDRDEEIEYIEFKIAWSPEENDKVIEFVNSIFFDDTDIKYEDLMIFINNFNVPECHNAACSLIEDSGVAEWLLRNGIGTVLSDDENARVLVEAGLNLEHKGKYSCVGKLAEEKPEKDLAIKVEGDGWFVPLKILEVPSSKFYDWYYDQDRFEIMRIDSEDFWYFKEKAVETIRKFRQNPRLFLEHYPHLKELVQSM